MLNEKLRGAAIKVAILQAGLTAGEVAALAGMSESRLSRTVCGRRQARWHELIEIARVCNVPSNWLVGHFDFGKQGVQ